MLTNKCDRCRQAIDSDPFTAPDGDIIHVECSYPHEVAA